jgi:hypothetical protein
VRVRVSERDESLRVLDRQRPEEDRIKNREDGGIGADAKRKRENGDKRKPRIFHEGAKSEADVLNQIFLGTPF